MILQFIVSRKLVEVMPGKGPEMFPLINDFQNIGIVANSSMKPTTDIVFGDTPYVFVNTVDEMHSKMKEKKDDYSPNLIWIQIKPSSTLEREYFPILEQEFYLKPREFLNDFSTARNLSYQKRLAQLTKIITKIEETLKPEITLKFQSGSAGYFKYYESLKENIQTIAIQVQFFFVFAYCYGHLVNERENKMGNLIYNLRKSAVAKFISKLIYFHIVLSLYIVSFIFVIPSVCFPSSSLPLQMAMYYVLFIFMFLFSYLSSILFVKSIFMKTFCVSILDLSIVFNLTLASDPLPSFLFKLHFLFPLNIVVIVSKMLFVAEVFK